MLKRNIFRYVFLLSIFFSCKTEYTIKNQISSLLIYENFKRSGTTGDIQYAFLQKKDTINSMEVEIDKSDLSAALKNSKVTKHFQQKIAGITLGGKFTENNKVHYFIYLRSNHLIIDLSEMKNYWLQDSLKIKTKL